MAPLLQLLSLLLLLFCSYRTTAAQSSNFSILHSPWRPTDNLTLFSVNHTFKAGFQRKNTSSGLFIFSIWVESSIDKTVVWSLKGDISNSSLLTISSNGTLSLNDSSGNIIWNATSTSNSKELVLGENGKLVYGNWNSFGYAYDHPYDTHTILADQPVHSVNLTLRSGSYQLVNGSQLMFNGTKYWGATSGFINMTSKGELLMENNQYITADVGDNVLRRLTLDSNGNLRVYSLDAATGSWNMVWQAIQELCIILGSCGLNAICIPVGSNSTRCECPPGYQKASSNSCILKKQYLPESKFLRLDFVAYSGGPRSEATPLSLVNCSSRCSANSSCIGYTYLFNGQRSCTNYFNQFIYGYWSPEVQRATYVRVTSSETDVSNFTGMTTMIETVCPVHISLPQPPKESKTTLRNLSIIFTLFAVELIVGISSFWAFLRKYSKYRDMARTFGLEYLPAGGPKRFSYAELKAATKDFSNVVGHGAYGMVYNGELPDGRTIAVKRLKNTGGGKAEFWTEVTIIARMHHLNLVHLWGFCAEKEQRMLVYEFVPNGSLDKFLFPPATRTTEEASDEVQDPEKKSVPRKPLLDWHIRYRIALGVARAIAYLHEECLEWVLHCDIKPENILLENDFCPKVSDFGLSKLTNKKEKVTMSRLRGTRGYMAPEWVIKSEPITAKADVYSYGMVLLEIVSGVRNFKFKRSSIESLDWYMPKWAYEKVYVQKKVEDILDPRIMDSYDSGTHLALIERMVKTAMWCLQDRAEMRPSMGKVAKMLEGTVEITEPEKPRIFLDDE